MRQLILLVSLSTCIFLFANSSFANTHLELGLTANTVIVHDEAYEAFSPDKLTMNRYGLDLRVEVFEFAKRFHLLPVIGYRFSQDTGNPYNIIDTKIQTHDFDAGIRLRAWITPWLGGFAQVTGGLMLTQMTGTIESDGQTSMKTEYSDSQTSWALSGLLGAEVRFSPLLLEKIEIRKFNLGAEISAGYVRRGNVKFSPTVDGGDKHSLDIVQTADLGSLNLSGWVIQFGITLSFF